MGRRGRKPLYAKREAFARLIAEKVPSARACRIVGVGMTLARARAGATAVASSRVVVCSTCRP